MPFIPLLYEMADSTIEPTNWVDVAIIPILLYNEFAIVGSEFVSDTELNGFN
jgi:hypothetical protein